VSLSGALLPQSTILTQLFQLLKNGFAINEFTAVGLFHSDADVLAQLFDR